MNASPLRILALALLGALGSGPACSSAPATAQEDAGSPDHDATADDSEHAAGDAAAAPESCPGYVTGSGEVAVARPPRDHIQSAALACLSGTGDLTGRFVSSITTVGQTPAHNADNAFVFTPDDQRFREVEVYYFITEMGRWLLPLLPDGMAPDALAPAAVSIDGGGDITAGYWDGQAIHLTGPTILDPTIFLHEYGHAVQEMISRQYPAAQRRSAVAEGFADLLAALFLGEPHIASWTMAPESAAAPCLRAGLRTVKHARRYPQDVLSAKDYNCLALECVTGLGMGPSSPVYQHFQQSCLDNGLASLSADELDLGDVLVAPLWDLGEAASPELAAKLALSALAGDLRSPVATLGPSLIAADGQIEASAHAGQIQSQLDFHGLMQSCGVRGDVQHASGAPCDSSCTGVCRGGACVTSGSTADELYQLVAQMAVADQAQRKAALLAALNATGLVPSHESFAAGDNLVVTVAGAAPAILLSAHFDSLSPGAVDNGSGVAILIALAKRLSTAPLAHATTFVFTDQEEAGLLGSEAYVAAHPGAAYLAVINVDLAGLGNALTLGHILNSNTLLRDRLVNAADAAQMPVILSSDLPPTDELSFLQGNVGNVATVGLAPAADLCSMLRYSDTHEGSIPALFQIMHSAADTPDKLQPAEMAALLDILLQALRDIDG